MLRGLVLLLRHPPCVTMINKASTLVAKAIYLIGIFLTEANVTQFTRDGERENEQPQS